MASSPERSSSSSSSSSPEKVAHPEEEEGGGGAAAVRSQEPEKKTKKKKSSGGEKSDKRRQTEAQDVDGKVGSDSGDECHKEEGSADDSPSRKAAAAKDKKAAGATEEQKSTSAGAGKKEEQSPAKEKEAAEDAWEHDRQPPITGPVNVVYCGVCGLPPDYCEFGSQWKRCKAWLEQHHPELLRYALPPEELSAAAAAKEVSGEKGGGPGGEGTAAAADGTPGHVNSSSSTSATDTAGDLAQEFAENLRLSAAATQQAAAALGLDAADDLSPDAQQAAEAKKKPAKGKAPAQPAVVTIQRQSRAKRKTMTVIVGLDFFGVKLSNATKIFSKRFACGASVSKNPLGHPPQQVEVQGDVEEAIVEVIESVFSVPADKIVLLPRK